MDEKLTLGFLIESVSTFHAVTKELEKQNKALLNHKAGIIKLNGKVSNLGLLCGIGFIALAVNARNLQRQINQLRSELNKHTVVEYEESEDTEEAVDTATDDKKEA